jgi:hypothetical protein
MSNAPSPPASAILYLVIALIAFSTAAFAQNCRQIVEDQTNNISIKGIYYRQAGDWSQNRLARNIVPGEKIWVEIPKDGPTEYRAELAGGQSVLGHTSDACAFSQIIIFQDSLGSPQMRIR